jgi:hypothetical protein
MRFLNGAFNGTLSSFTNEIKSESGNKLRLRRLVNPVVLYLASNYLSRTPL